MTRRFVRILVWLFLAFTECRSNRVQNCYRAATAGLYYRGTNSTTINGNACLSWTSNDDYKPDDYPQADIGDHNYCRNPKGDPYDKPWCFINKNKKWEYCDVQECADTSCYSVIDFGGGYRGTVNQDKDGNTCIKWSASGSDLESNYMKQEFTKYGIGDHNYCRNPYPDSDDHNKPYCQYKKDGNINEKDCDIPKCNDVPVITQTCGGNGGGKACKFPFEYDSKRFVECTNYKISTSSWCATKLDGDGKMEKWGHCYCGGPTTSAVPSTAAPSTAAPSSVIPSTATPSTSIPSTSAPTTAAASTAAPSIAALSSVISSTSIPSTSTPTTAAASTAAPSTAAPSISIPSTTTPSTAAPLTAALSTTSSTTATKLSTTDVIATNFSRPFTTSKETPTSATNAQTSKSFSSTTTVHATNTLSSLVTSSQTSNEISSQAAKSAKGSRSESLASTTATSKVSTSGTASIDSKVTANTVATTDFLNSVTTAARRISPTVGQQTTRQSDGVPAFLTSTSSESAMSERASTARMNMSTSVQATASLSATTVYAPQGHESEKHDGIVLIAAPAAAVGCLIVVIVIILLVIRRRRRSGKLCVPKHHTTEIGVLNPTYSVADVDGEYVDPNLQQNYAAVGPQHEPAVDEDGYLATNEALSKSRKYNQSQTVEDKPLLTSAYVDLIEDEQPQVSRNFSTNGEEDAAVYLEPADTIEGIYEQFESRRYRKLDVKSIQMFDSLGSGAFGDVHRAEWKKNVNDKITVAVKTLNSKANEEDKVKFMQEAAIMGQFKHKHVVSLIGVVTEGDALMVVLEFMANGDLKQYLQDVRLHLDDSQEAEEKLQVKLLQMAREIASGMKYLSAKRFVHRDLAARNVMLDSERKCKIGDFGLSRDIAEDSYYRSKQNGKIPVRWTAPEALNFKKYSSASDVWSYGIVLYEIWSVGMRPYGKKNNSDVLSMIDHGYRLPPPPGCPRPIYALMIECWHPNHHKRPSFRDIVSRLAAPTHSLLTNNSQSEGEGGHVGDPLRYAEMLYKDLQRSYKD